MRFGYSYKALMPLRRWGSLPLGCSTRGRRCRGAAYHLADCGREVSGNLPNGDTARPASALPAEGPLPDHARENTSDIDD